MSQECKELICHLLDENAENRYKIEIGFEKSNKKNVFIIILGVFFMIKRQILRYIT